MLACARGLNLACCPQTSADFLGKQAKQLREDALNWADRLEKDVAGKERDTEALKQEHQRDTSRLKVGRHPV